mmetsp:Transcript_9648/g.30583  ORF Transcript_9648/g.30583 Transcript_9648/m.30583 type:complete len:355 (-) Transcript_9648:1408-2472(-)
MLPSLQARATSATGSVWTVAAAMSARSRVPSMNDRALSSLSGTSGVLGGVSRAMAAASVSRRACRVPLASRTVTPATLTSLPCSQRGTPTVAVATSTRPGSSATKTQLSRTDSFSSPDVVTSASDTIPLCPASSKRVRRWPCPFEAAATLLHDLESCLRSASLRRATATCFGLVRNVCATLRHVRCSCCPSDAGAPNGTSAPPRLHCRSAASSAAGKRYSIVPWAPSLRLTLCPPARCSSLTRAAMFLSAGTVNEKKRASRLPLGLGATAKRSFASRRFAATAASNSTSNLLRPLRPLHGTHACHRPPSTVTGARMGTSCFRRSSWLRCSTNEVHGLSRSARNCSRSGCVCRRS